MGMFLNSRIPYADYCETVSETYFVDKSALIGELLAAVGKKNRYFCITRPRRFGKSVMANMVAAYFGKSADAGGVFDRLAVSEHPQYAVHRSSYDLVFIDFSRMPENCSSYQEYIGRISRGLKNDLLQEYPGLGLDPKQAVWDLLQAVYEALGSRFVFVMDEWDAVFYKPFITQEDKMSYLEFLKNLLKGQMYTALVYMTGVLAIAKYSSGSELNMFLEYDMVTKKKFSSYFGFLDTEVDRLYEIYQQETKDAQISREDLRVWYDGYCAADGNRIYNPQSVVYALTDNALSNYWTSSGPYDELFYYIRSNVDAVKDDLAYMVAGEKVPMVLQDYTAANPRPQNRHQIYSAMVVYGLLAYDGKCVSIPNKELMDKYRELFINNDRLGYIHSLAIESEKMLSATLAGDTKTMAAILKYTHDTEAPIFSYNSEIELSAVVNLVYLAARDRYYVEREDKAGEGFVDFIFYPVSSSDDAVILELKVDASPAKAICQIKEKGYALRLQGKLGEKRRCTGRILAVGISYNKKTKEHACEVEQLA